MRQDLFAGEGQSLVVFIRNGTDLSDGTMARIGDHVALPAAQAWALCERGAADYVTAPATAEKADG